MITNQSCFHLAVKAEAALHQNITIFQWLHCPLNITHTLLIYKNNSVATKVGEHGL